MPFLHLRYTGITLSGEATATLRAVLLDAMTTVMRKKRSLTAILIERVDPATAAWSIGDTSPTSAAHLEVAVTDGTNTAEEKERFVAHAFEAMRAAFGPDLPEASYVIVRDIAADAWGYGGRTQAARQAQQTPPTEAPRDA